MSQSNKSTVKTYFNTGDRPTESQFFDFIDSSFNDYVDITNFGAVGDDSTNNTSSFNNAKTYCQTNNKNLYIPEGVFIVDPLTLDASFNGLKIVGGGYNSVLKLRGQTFSSNDALISITDGGNDLLNIEFHNFRIDGNKGNVTDGGNQIRGIITSDNGQSDKDIVFDTIWVHDCPNGPGISINTANSFARNIRSWNNGSHGIVTNVHSPVLSNIYCYDNGGLGIDFSGAGGGGSVSQFICDNNATGGIKTSVNASSVIIENGILRNNNGPGFYSSGLAEIIQIDQVAAIDNQDTGFYFSFSGNTYLVGTIYADGNNISNSDQGNIEVFNDVDCYIDSLYSINAANGDGIHIGSSTTNVSIDNAVTINNPVHGIEINSGNCSIKSGYSSGNGVHDIRSEADVNKSSISNFVTDGFFVIEEPTSGDVTFRDCDLSAASLGMVDQASNIHAINNLGYNNASNGQSTQGGGSSSYTIAHGLDSTPTFFNVNAGSADASGISYITADSTDITVNYSSATPSGTNNITFIWEASFND